MSPALPQVLGRVPDPPDDRDHLYRVAIQPTALPRPALYRTNMIGPIIDQGPTPHCVTYATTGSRNRHEKIETGKYVFAPTEKTYKPGKNPSAEWLYTKCKEIDGWAGDGTNARAALTVMQREGLIGPTGTRRYGIGQYARLQSVDEIMEAVWLHGIVLLGMTIDTNWEQPVAGRIGPPNGNVWGGHEIAVVGYRDSTTSPVRDRGLWIKNSQGSWWGAKGYARLPLEHLDYYDDWDAWWVEDTSDQ